MAKDGTRRGGARVGSGPKTSKIPPPLINFEGDFDAEKQDFGSETVKKSTSKLKNQAKTSEKTTVKSKTTSKLQSKSTSTTAKSRKAAAKSVKKSDNDDLPELEGVDVPPVDEYLRSQQKCGKSLRAEHIFEQTMKWLKDIKCAGAVSKQLVEQYAMSVARWIQTEELISETGFLAKHPTTGQAIASPYVLMSQNYMKQVNQLWCQIYQIVKERCSEGILEETDDPMERLLRERGG